MAITLKIMIISFVIALISFILTILFMGWGFTDYGMDYGYGPTAGVYGPWDTLSTITAVFFVFALVIFLTSVVIHLGRLV